MTVDVGGSRGAGAAPEGALRPYLRAINAHRVLVALCTLAALVGCVAWLSQRTPQYEATAEILVIPLPQGSDDPYQGLQFLRDSGDPTRTIQTAATLIESAAAAQRTARLMGGGWTRDSVGSNVRVQPQGESSVLAITGKATSGEEAAKLANTYAGAALAVRSEELRRAVESQLDRLGRQQERLVASGREEAAADLAREISALEGVRDGNDPTLSSAEDAVAPTTSLGTPGWLLVLLALAAGFAIGSALALLRELTDRRIRDEEELVTLFPAPVLARAPIMRGRRRRGPLSPADMPPGVREAFRTLRVQLERQPGTHRTVMLTSATSGDGKTTSAINLALSLVGGGHRVVLIDFDLRKPDLAAMLGIDARRSLVSTLTGTPLHELLTPAPQLPPLQVVPAASTEGDVALLESLRRRMPAILEEARMLADYVVLDTAPLGEVADALTIADQVDDIMIVARPGHSNRANMESVRDLLNGAGLTPTGFLLVGERSGHSTAYHTYGTPPRDRGSARRPLARAR
jgi:Mrp family chromosome partitioning ATPase/capsular polysaccharide biosynthesis protein